jgi:hypothetical protein
MKKTLLLFLIVVILGAAIYYLYPKAQPAPIISPNSTSTVMSPSSSIPHTPVDMFGDYQSNSFFDSFINTSTKATISFSEVPSSGAGGSGNSSVNVYLNKKNIGQVEVGPAEAQFGFSPDNKYFTWRNQLDGGGGSFNYEIDVINLATEKIITINQPVVSFSDPNIDATESVSGLMESYVWNGGAINVIFYFVGTEADGKYYRLSPKQIWRYDLMNGGYTLFQTLPETSSTGSSLYPAAL